MEPAPGESRKDPIVTRQKHLKKLIRARMERTGESYTSARAHIVDTTRTPLLGDARVVDAHGRHGQSVIFSPDGKWVVSGGQDRAIRFHEVGSLQPGPVLEGHEKVVTSLGMTADGNRLVSASSDRTVRLWKRASGGWAGSPLGSHRDTVTVIALDSTQEKVASSGYDSRVCVWDLAEGEKVIEAVSTIDRVTSLVFLPDGETLAEAGLGGEIIVRSSESLEEKRRLTSDAPGILGLAVSPDGAILAAAEAEGKLTLWSLEEPEPLREIALEGNAQAVAITPDGRFLASSWDRNVGIWDFESDDPVAATGVGIKGVYSLAFDQAGERLALTGADGRVRVWDLYP